MAWNDCLKTDFYTSSYTSLNLGQNLIGQNTYRHLQSAFITQLKLWLPLVETKYQSNSTFGRGARASYRTMLPEISARRSVLEPSFTFIPVARQEGKQMMAPRPYVTEPFRPLSWINNWSQFLYTPISKNVVAENGQWQLSIGNCTNERNFGFHIWYAKKLVLCVAQNWYRLTNGQLAPA